MAEATRIDKYLWAIRAFKTRSDATDACRGGKVLVNGMGAKPSRNVSEGDVISVRRGLVTYSYKVLAVIEKRQGAKLVSQFAEDITPQSELDKLKQPTETFFLRRDPGTGRPTKKERRQMEDLWEPIIDPYDDDDGDDD
ncbi:MAG: RNA-binding S4 domain-containing protein [Bacteroidales bacterium]|nr:RNA-binding S4 domain-containing protein [Bacteroidales bacterium]